MGNITLTNTFVNATVADADEVNTNFTDIVTTVNGSIDGTNISSGSALSIASLTTSGAATITGALQVDTIAEKTSATGVTIDGVLLKDGVVKKRVTTIASSATPTPNADTTDIYTVTALAEAAAFGAVTGTPVQGQTLLIRIKDNATARALTWNAIYRAGTDVSLPTTTVLSKTIYVGFVYNSTDTKWDLVFTADGF